MASLPLVSTGRVSRGKVSRGRVSRGRVVEALVCLCSLAFIAILVMVCVGFGITSLDHRVALAVKPDYENGWFKFGRALTDVVSPYFDALVLAITATVVSVRQRTLAALAVAAWVGAVTVLVIVNVKYAVGRDAPGGYAVRGGEFPSGHTACAIMFLGTSAWLATTGRARTVAILAVTLLSLLVGGSLIYIRSHWLSDVAGSLLVSPLMIYWTAMSPAAAAWKRHTESRKATLTRRENDRRSPS